MTMAVIQQVHASVETGALLALVERGLDLQARAVARALHPLHGTSSDRATRLIERAAARTATLAWALQRFPQIDPEVIRMTKRADVVMSRSWNDQDGVTLHGLDVPAFTILQLWGGDSTTRIERSAMSTDFRLGSSIRLGYTEMTWNAFMTAKTVRMIQEAKQNPNDLRLVAITPTLPPLHIQDRVAPLMPRFDRTDLLFEAEWRGMPAAKDPLVIGTLFIDGSTAACFVLAAYDQTSLEAYIGREFATGPA